ncbi:MAG: signal peptidase I [Chloroflexi bacterium]|nr:signal peptidase I [Chloroflexota bacterium]|tara:strand:+ start:43 stop:444 length:402 start_codon:yes stop_codon:yes gene_type:complete
MNIYNVKGNSMSPALKEGDLLFVKKSTSKNFKLKANDIIILNNPDNPNSYIIKRLIGLPNEKIEDINKRNYSLVIKTDNNISDYQLSINEYFVIGDNHNYSTDSRHFGPIKYSEIIGKVILRIWPFYRIKYWF